MTALRRWWHNHRTALTENARLRGQLDAANARIARLEDEQTYMWNRHLTGGAA